MIHIWGPGPFSPQISLEVDSRGGIQRFLDPLGRIRQNRGMASISFWLSTGLSEDVDQCAVIEGVRVGMWCPGQIAW